MKNARRGKTPTSALDKRHTNPKKAAAEAADWQRQAREDAAWFIVHPHRQYRLRCASSSEQSRLCCHHVVVRQLAPGARQRIAVFDPSWSEESLPLPDTEAFALAVAELMREAMADGMIPCGLFALAQMRVIGVPA